MQLHSRAACRSISSSVAFDHSVATEAGGPGRTAAGASFREIAGNRSAILVSALVPEGWAPAKGDRVLFTQPLLTRPGTRRVALVVPVTTLAGTLRAFRGQQVTLEHVYDY